MFFTFDATFLATFISLTMRIKKKKKSSFAVITHNAMVCQKLFVLKQLGPHVCAVSQCHLFNADYILTHLFNADDPASSTIHHANL